MTAEKRPAAPAGPEDAGSEPEQDLEDDRHARSGANEALFTYLKAHDAVLFKKDSAFRVRIAGTAQLDGERIPFCLVPPNGSLMKAGKWKKTSPEQRLDLVRERVNAKAVAAMTQRVTDFLSRAQGLARELNLEADQFWPGLVTDGQDEEGRYATILDRMRAAHAKLQESRNAERARAAISLKDYPESFPAASMPRRFIALLGPTNSGKTHRAVDALKTATSGVYLAPLRLLANENYERLYEAGVAVSLITGEERKLHPHPTHYASTVEMLDPHRPVDVAVIDEVQMLEDAERGGAWTAAVCGVPAQAVFLLGSPTAEPALHALAARLGVPMSVEHLERKAPLEVEPRALGGLNALRPGDALIAFSRRDVLFLAQQLSRMGRSVATIYGALSPEARRAQARRFESGEASIVVATDAIGMGLNLPIRRVLFSTMTKFDGQDDRPLNESEVHQIAGRAGRYGLHEEGFVGVLRDAEPEAARVLKDLLRKPPRAPADFKAPVAPNWWHVSTIASRLRLNRLRAVLDVFMEQLRLDYAHFAVAALDQMLELAARLDEAAGRLPLRDRFVYAQAPVDTRSDAQVTEYLDWASNHAVSGKAGTPWFLAEVDEHSRLDRMEQALRSITLWLWLDLRFPDVFGQVELVLDLRERLNEGIERQLKGKKPLARRTRGFRR
jgi:ATP-dependent RNA helicase SUPV3L1/SUV3